MRLLVLSSTTTSRALSPPPTLHGRIDVELADELAVLCQFDDFTRVVRIGINRVAVAGDQVAVRRKLPAPLVHVAVRPWQ
jgi:hypothetical protein